MTHGSSDESAMKRRMTMITNDRSIERICSEKDLRELSAVDHKRGDERMMRRLIEEGLLSASSFLVFEWSRCC